ncbi:MAG: thiamine-phosphate kinase, partial [Candidatus Binataceae bacterium]
MLTLGIGDDCAIIKPARGEELLITTDLSLENVHFRRDWHPPESIGHRCLARGLSDLAAMGARPEAALLSLALPPELRGRWMERFFDGLLALALRYSVPLAGGDIAQSPARGHDARRGLAMADMVLLGSAAAGCGMRRSGAQPGDGIYVTGALG